MDRKPAERAVIGIIGFMILSSPIHSTATDLDKEPIGVGETKLAWFKRQTGTSAAKRAELKSLKKKKERKDAENKDKAELEDLEASLDRLKRLQREIEISRENLEKEMPSIVGETGKDEKQLFQKNEAGRKMVAQRPKLIRRSHSQLNTKEDEREFLQLFAKKRSTMEELIIIRRLLKEKKLELAGFNRALVKNFSINPDANYHYNANTMTIYEIVNEPSSDTLQKIAQDKSRPPEKRVYLRLKNKKASRQFIYLAAAKKMTLDEIRALKFMILEKQMELEQCENVLHVKFLIAKDRNYLYNTNNMTVIELVSMPISAGEGKE